MASKMSKRFTGFLSRSKSVASPQPGSSARSHDIDIDNAPADSPEARAGRGVRLFCESGGASNGGEEVLHLPVIVEAAESSPTAAAAACQQIRRYLGRDFATRPHVQYNAVMLCRILSDHPGASFTRNFDKTFVSSIKEALRMCRDPSTQQILREMLDTLEVNKASQEGVDPLIQMWRKEKGQQGSLAAPAPRSFAPQAYSNDFAYGQQAASLGRPSAQRHGSTHGSRSKKLPPAVELASRIEEARNTARILLQLIQSTPSEELLHNDLIREFADRCQSAQRSMQGYIGADNPPPDDETMLTLIETNEQLSLATTRYQRSLLNARKAMGATPSPNAEAMQNSARAPPRPPPTQPEENHSVFAPSRSPPSEPPGLSAFGAASESYQAPSGPPPPRQSSRLSAFSGPEESYSPPPNPPAAMLARFNSRDSQPSPNQLAGGNQDPFADPVSHTRTTSPPLAYDSTSYGNPGVARNSADRPLPQMFSVDAGPTYAPGHIHNVSMDSENPYDSSPTQTRAKPPSLGTVSPVQSSARPYQTSQPTPSYLGRQASAGDHLTMHGAQPTVRVPEIDGHSEVGRKPVPAFDRSYTGQTDTDSSAYGITPEQTRR